MEMPRMRARYEISSTCTPFQEAAIAPAGWRLHCSGSRLRAVHGAARGPRMCPPSMPRLGSRISNLKSQI